jgi:DNA polymerase I-like protein with 3'-5' exonuclease and polymerase domains
LLKDYFFTPMGLNLKPKLVTEKTKEPSTAKNHLEMFFDVPEAKAMCEVLDGLGGATKTLSTYAIGFLKHLRADGRLHPTYFLHSGGNDWGDDDGGTVTGRLSAKDPAVQTIPKKTKWGKRIRECFIAPPGYVCLEVDYSQGELRLTACIADEPNMIAAYKAGIDLHCKTGASLAGMSLEEFMALEAIDPDKFGYLRGKAKPANFGIIYGISWEGYKTYAWNGYRVSMTDQEAMGTVDGFFVTYPELPNWHKRYRAMAHRDGFVTSPLGRVRHLPHIHAWDSFTRSKAERQAVNSPVQATLSDMMVYATAEVNDNYPEYIPFAMIHDADYFYVLEDKAQEAAKNVTAIMSNLPLRQVFGWDHQLDFPADATVGPDLGHMVKVKLAA